MVLGLAVVGAMLGTGIAMLILPSRGTSRTTIRTHLDEAGLSGAPISVVAITLVLVATIAGALSAVVIPIPAIAPLATLAGAAIPIVVLLGARDRRRRRARAAWPDVIDAIRMSLRSGSTLGDAVSAATPMIPSEWSTAWAELDSNLRRGADVGRAMRRFQRLLADPIADRLVEAILVTREFGGPELPTVLAALARSVRREQSLRNEAQTRQSWVRHAATLGVVAPWIVLAMLASRPENRSAYSSLQGTLLIITSAGATVVAFFVMKALGTVPEPRRWLTRTNDE